MTHPAQVPYRPEDSPNGNLSRAIAFQNDTDSPDQATETAPQNI